MARNIARVEAVMRSDEVISVNEMSMKCMEKCQ